MVVIVYQSVECAFLSPVSIVPGMLLTCCMPCGDVVSLGG